MSSFITPPAAKRAISEQVAVFTPTKEQPPRGLLDPENLLPRFDAVAFPKMDDKTLFPALLPGAVAEAERRLLQEEAASVTRTPSL